MTQEDKDLLIKDLCARLPYGVKVNVFARGIYTLEYVYKSHFDGDYKCSLKEKSNSPSIFNNVIKPYLFPLSSMIKEQRDELLNQGIIINCKGLDNIEDTIADMVKWIDWLNVHHFDYRGLIDKGLAIDATNLNIY